MDPIPYPRRVALAHTPTPLMELKRLNIKEGPTIYLKRDDLTGSEVSGNKIRKLEFLLAQALDQGRDLVITCGGAQSNHARATAAAATRLGLSSRLVLRTEDPKNPPPLSGNILLDRMVGAEIIWITPEQYQDRAALMEEMARELSNQGRKPYLVPEGGSTGLGAFGYMRAVEELAVDLAGLPGGTEEPLTIIAATGSGGTLAGLALGAKLTGLPARVVGVNVAADRDYFVREVSRIGRQAQAEYGLAAALDPDRDFEILDGYVGLGYAISRPEELAAIRDLARAEGVILDPVYTGKAYYGMISELNRDPDRFGSRIVFFHTGGLFGLFPKADQLAELL
jgi:D-cysteine desulfhydrase